MAAWVLVCSVLLLGHLHLINTEENDETSCDEKGEFWKAGNVYRYNYKSVSKGLAVGTTERATGVKVTCTVDLHAPGQCHYILKVSECKLYEIETPGIDKKMIQHPNSEEFSSQLSRNSLPFTMTGGKITALYVSPEETTFVTNIKRGILTALQGNKREQSSDEWESRTDIHGTCPTKYQFQGDHLKVTKNMKECHHPRRHDWQLSPWSLFWNMTFIQHWWMNSTFECNYSFTSNALGEVVCSERHAILLESYRNTTTAVQTVIRQTLELISTNEDNSDFHQSIKERETANIEFVWEIQQNPTEIPENFLEKGKKLMDDLVTTSHLEIRTFTVPMFDELISLLRMSPEVLYLTQTLWQCRKENGCSDLEMHLTKSYLQDALLQCNSVPCMKALRWLVTKKHMSSQYFNFMMLTWTNLHITQPEMIDEIWNICKVKPTRICLLSLTSIIHTYVVKHQQKDKLPAVGKTVDLLESMIGNNCDPESLEYDLPRHELIEGMILALKAIGNLGSIAQETHPALPQILYNCAVNNKIPQNVSLEAIKAFRRMENTQQMYTQLTGILGDRKKPMTQRITSYLILCNHFPEPRVFQEVANLLPEEESTQLLIFVAMHIEDVITSNDSQLKRLQKAMATFLSQQPRAIDLNAVKRSSSTSSRHRHYSYFSKFPYIRKELNRLGLDITQQTIFETSSFIPKQLMLNWTSTIFSQVFNLFNVDVNIEGLEPVLEALFGPTSVLRKADSIEELLHSLQTNPLMYVGGDDSVWENHFDDEIEDRLNEFHQRIAHKPQSPSLAIGLKLFGDDIVFTSWDRINQGVMRAIAGIMSSPSNSYNITRVVRFIEGHFQVPTMSGFPLYWSTNATVAISARHRLQPQPADHLSARFSVLPSSTITFMNRMLLDVPYFTRLGIQANTTLYRSVQLEGQLDYQHGDVTLTPDVPKRSQEIASLFRVNQIIRGDNIEEIPDEEDVDRVVSERCYTDGYSGLQVCSHKSYANVTHQVKPWTLMAANAQFRYWIQREDPGLNFYKVHIKRQTKESEVNYKVHFEAPGEIWSREFQGQLNYNYEDGNLSFRFDVPNKPHLYLEYKNEPILDEGEQLGSKTSLSTQLDSSGPFLIVSYVDRIEASLRTSPLKNKNRPSKMGSHYVTTHNNILNVKYRNKDFSWNRKQVVYGSVERTENHLTYHSEDISMENYLIPHEFWENEKQAWFKINTESDVNPTSGLPLTHVSMQLPKSLLEIDWNLSNNVSRVAYGLYMTKRSLPSQELQAYFNFTYDNWETVSGDFRKVIYISTLKLPGEALHLEVYRDISDESNNHTVFFSGVTTVDKEGENEESSSWNITCRANSHKPKLREDSRNVPHKSYFDFLLIYPFGEKYENITLLADMTTQDTEDYKRKFHKDLTMKSSYWQFVLTGNTDLTIGRNEEILDHNSKIVHLPTSEEATNKLYWKRQDVGIQAEHRIRSFIFNSDAELETKAFHDADGREILQLTNFFKSHCPQWDGLNMDVHYSGSYGSGIADLKIDFKHKLLDYQDNITAVFPFTSYYHRRTHLKSKNDVIPSFEASMDRAEELRIFFPKSQWNLYLSTNYMSPLGGMTFHLYHNEENSKENRTIGQIHTIMLANNKLLIDYKLDEKEKEKLTKAFSFHVYQIASEWSAFISDPNNDMNKMLKPYMKTDTLDQYLDEIRKTIYGWLFEGFQYFFLLLDTLFTTFQSIIELISNITYYIIVQLAADEKIRKLSWLWNYFDVTGLVADYFEQSEQVAVTYTSPISNTLIIDLREFIDLSEFFGKKVINFPQRHLDKSYDFVQFVRELTSRRVASIFLDNHVYTFDGAAWNFPGYSHPSCTFLLAHDSAHRRFSILSQEKSIHLLFPEVAVTIDDQHKVAINGSKAHHDLPLRTWNNHVVVKVTSPNTIHITTKYGIEVICHRNDASCFFYSEIWNHAKTVGLLGNNDKEPNNDFMTPDGTLEHDKAKFASHYSLSELKTCTNFKRSQNSRQLHCQQSINALGWAKCEDYFDVYKSNSSLSRCHNIVDPRFILDTCREKVLCGGFTSLCPLIRTYIRLCKNHDVHLEVPAECVQCNDKGSSWSQENQKKLEVVLVVDESNAHLKNGTSVKGLESLLDNIEATFKKERYTSIRYGLVSYGDGGNSIHTVQSKWFKPLLGMINFGLKSLEFRSKKPHCAFRSLQMAANNFPFREEASRVLLLIVPEDKQRQYELCGAHLHDVHKTLERNGITLYVISHYKEIPSKKKVFGIRGDGYIFPQPKTGDAYLDYPKGVYAKLAAGSRGAVFHQSFLESGDTPRFFSEISAEILAKVGKEAKMCKKCRCVNRGNEDRAECTVTECIDAIHN